MREFSKVSSNWRSQQVAEEYLEQFKIPVLGRYRYEGAGAASARSRRDARRDFHHGSRYRTNLLQRRLSIPKMDGTDLAKVVSTKRPYVWEIGERSHGAGGRGGREG